MSPVGEPGYHPIAGSQRPDSASLAVARFSGTCPLSHQGQAVDLIYHHFRVLSWITSPKCDRAPRSLAAVACCQYWLPGRFDCANIDGCQGEYPVAAYS